MLWTSYVRKTPLLYVVIRICGFCDVLRRRRLQHAAARTWNVWNPFGLLRSMIQKAAAAGWRERRERERDVASIGPLPCFETPQHRHQRKGSHWSVLTSGRRQNKEVLWLVIADDKSKMYRNIIRGNHRVVPNRLQQNFLLSSYIKMKSEVPCFHCNFMIGFSSCL